LAIRAEPLPSPATIQHLARPGAVVGKLRIAVLDIGPGRNGAAHRNTPRRLGARAGMLLATAVCRPEGKHMARAEQPRKGVHGGNQAFPLLPAVIAQSVRQAQATRSHRNRQRAARAGRDPKTMQ
jgi:hypothetical protein